jgi:hypothetical protein
MLATRVRGGPLDPPAGPTTATDSVRLPGTPISSLPVTITEPGNYYLTRNLTGPCCPEGIVISATGVTLDLGGFTLAGPGAGFPAGISVQNSHSGVTIRNGTIRDWGGWGINANGAGFGVTISGVTVLSNGVGIELSDRSTVRDSMIAGSTVDGLRLSDANYVHDNVIVDSTSRAIRVDGDDNHVRDNYLGDPLLFNGDLNEVHRNRVCGWGSSPDAQLNDIPSESFADYEDTGSGHKAIRPERNSC